ncbi:MULTISPECIES: TetR/AcrR family transcriptional regulator C-terminal domain-containing protein [unclassified Brevibacterium]|uniref:TetR/AcrR family transcriptional regulator C-terminal domain-containing protein n=1 Tax=unclassified Brevibacterium TaxID=2614124 RepID=UPI001092C5F0|nr:TetR/AcrR family transcriptional regulator C-terminal domain-containing protein [Brevibacterium sp. S22]TGD27966.1 TetR family transcriptional regulator [Brevibacterium sp. S22]
MALNQDLIVREAFALLDEDGLDGLTLRRLASRLDVQAPTLYWHIRNKAELLAHLGDGILSPLNTLPDSMCVDWREWLLDAAVRFRAALLAHRDGARVVSAAQLSPAMADFSEHVMSVLVPHMPLHQARLLVLLIERFTLGVALEEQSGAVDSSAASPLEASEIAARYPLLTKAIADYFADGATLEDLYRESLQLILASLAD